jgi:hypothetical protein
LGTTAAPAKFLASLAVTLLGFKVASNEIRTRITAVKGHALTINDGELSFIDAQAQGPGRS